MQLKVFLLSAFVLGIVSLGFGQSTRDTNVPKPPAPKYQAVKKQKKGLFKKRVKRQTGAEEIAEFRKQLKKRLDDKAVEARKADKPQYTNPLYFGHKKPPKKRKSGKKKFCKECGIVH